MVFHVVLKTLSRSKEDVQLDFDQIERWLVMKCPLFEEIYVFALAMSFGIAVSSAATG